MDLADIKLISIEEFCLRQRIEMQGSGRYRSLKDHDSCVINTEKNEFYWNSRQKNGDIINFVQEYYQISFREALEILGGTSFRKENSPKPVSKKILSLEEDLQEDRCMKHCFAYLMKKRKLSSAVLQEMVKRGLMRQDRRRNIIFKSILKGRMIGFVKIGSTDIPYKYIHPESDIKGFLFPVGQAKRLIFFESVIDLLSYYQLFPEKSQDSLLISMHGLKQNCVLKNMEYFHYSDIVLAVDQDEAGDLFCERLMRMKIAFSRELPASGKDWNEMLQKEGEG